MRRRVASGLAMACALWAWIAPPPGAVAQTSPAAVTKPAVGGARVVTARGTVQDIDKANGTVTLKGERGRTLTLDVQDPQKLNAVEIGDPVVAVYYESIAIEVRKAGSTVPGVTRQEARATSKPGDVPAGAISRQVTVTATVTAVDASNQTVTITGPQGRVKTVKVQDPQNLSAVNVGDLVEVTYTEALAVALDKEAK
jgi:Cu/Ag efflux protein CusF